MLESVKSRHINPYFGKMLLCDIAADDIAHYQTSRLAQGAASKTVNLEVETLRAVLRKNRLWAAIQPDVWMLRARYMGRAISRDEEAALLEACRASRCWSLYSLSWLPSTPVCVTRNFDCSSGDKLISIRARLQSDSAKPNLERGAFSL